MTAGPAGRPSRVAGFSSLADAVAVATRSAVTRTGTSRLAAAWQEVAGAAVARETYVGGVRGGIVTIVCSSAVWSTELGLLAGELGPRLAAASGEPVERLRFRVGGRRERLEAPAAAPIRADAPLSEEEDAWTEATAGVIHDHDVQSAARELLRAVMRRRNV